MPTYQYACTDAECGNRFELVQSFTDPSASECPVCSHAVRKVYGSVGIVFKGSGFYRNDSRAGAGGESADASAADSKSEAGTKSEEKTDSKKETASTSDSASKSESTSKSGSKSDAKAASGSTSETKPATKSPAPAASS